MNSRVKILGNRFFFIYTKHIPSPFLPEPRYNHQISTKNKKMPVKIEKMPVNLKKTPVNQPSPGSIKKEEW